MSEDLTHATMELDNLAAAIAYARRQYGGGMTDEQRENIARRNKERSQMAAAHLEQIRTRLARFMAGFDDERCAEVLRLHYPRLWLDTEPSAVCDHCMSLTEEIVEWPCETAQVLVGSDWP